MNFFTKTTSVQPKTKRTTWDTSDSMRDLEKPRFAETLKDPNESAEPASLTRGELLAKQTEERQKVLKEKFRLEWVEYFDKLKPIVDQHIDKAVETGNFEWRSTLSDQTYFVIKKLFPDLDTGTFEFEIAEKTYDAALNKFKKQYENEGITVLIGDNTRFTWYSKTKVKF